MKKKKEKLLLSADSNYAIFLNKSVLRLKTGESNILEKTTAETQRGNIQLQLHSLQQQMEVTKARFQYLLNTNNNVEPAADTIAATIPAVLDSSMLAQHPLLRVYQQQEKIAAATTRLERSKLLPDLSVGYFSQTFRGVGPDEKTYSSSDRFNAFQVSVGVPIFSGVQKAKANAAKVNEEIAANNFNLQLQNLQTGTTWRLSSLEELNTLLVKTLDKSGLLLPGGPTTGKSLPNVARLDNEVE